MELRELRHEVLDLLQSVVVHGARLQQLLPPGATAEREVVEQLLKRAYLCRDRVHGDAATEPALDAATAPAPAADKAAPVATGLPRLRVVVVEDDPAVRTFLADTIQQRCGHQVVAAAGSGPEMVRQVLAQEPDLVVFDIHLPGMDGLSALHVIMQEQPIAAVAVTGDRNTDLVRRALEDNILAYLIKPVEASQVAVAIQIAWARFNEFCQLRSENQSLQQTLKDRKIIERAKGALMKKHNWSEATAFRTLQRTAMTRRTTIAHLAQDILDGKDVKFVS